MDSFDYEERFRAMRAAAQGQWTGILRELGVSEKILSRRNQPCPIAGCGGTDRFQYTDKFGEGNYHCRYCGAGGGFKLLRAVTGWSASEALLRIERCLGSPTRGVDRTEKSRADGVTKLARRIWAEASPISHNDEAYRYLAGRKLQLDRYPDSLRFHPALGYYQRTDDGQTVLTGEYPALLARVTDQSGALTTLHRTYLKNGAKAPVSDPKKMLCGGVNGGSIRLADATDILNVCEGLENALAIFKRREFEPVWSGISAGNMQRLWIPPCVRVLRVYADNDADSDFAGQVAAFTLARAARKRNVDVKVFVPHKPGSDWADVWYARADHLIRVA